MEGKWSLKELYDSFEDSKFLNDIETIKQLLKDMGKYPELDNNEENLKQYLIDNNNLCSYTQKLGSFISLSMSTDTNDKDAIKYYALLEKIQASFALTDARINKWLALFDLDKLKDEYVLEHLFLLKEMQSSIKYSLDERSEEVIANMKTTGSSSWLQYKNQIISSMKVKLDDKEYALTEILNFAYSDDADLRKKAYEAEIAAYKDVENGISAALNAIKGEALTETKLRGYDSVLERTLIDSRMKRKTLDVLLSTVKKALPVFEKYYTLKAKTLGYENGLPWYDMYAPVVKAESSYPYDKGCEFVVKQFSTFSKELGDYAKKAMDNQWIDVYPRSGKVGGAFCDNINCIKESRILLNYGNQFSDVSTMAHELGHGYHGECLKDECLLNTSYTMPIAETASIFCETIVKKAALKEASKEEALAIIENEICDSGQVVCDIYSRFLFESKVFEEREEGPLSAERLKEIMRDAQKEAYGKGLDHNVLHPYMWTWKPHYYEADYNFYNFPYTFGLLLAKGLYGMYKKEGDTFPAKYVKFLSMTGKMSIEDVAMSVGIDLQDEKFWQNSIDMIKEDIDLFEQLLKECHK